MSNLNPREREAMAWEPSEAELEAAIRAAYDDQPQWYCGTMIRPSEHRAKTFEECYGCAPLEHAESVHDVTLILVTAHRAAITAHGEPHRITEAMIESIASVAIEGLEARNRANHMLWTSVRDFVLLWVEVSHRHTH